MTSYGHHDIRLGSRKVRSGASDLQAVVQEPGDHDIAVALGGRLTVMDDCETRTTRHDNAQRIRCGSPNAARGKGLYLNLKACSGAGHDVQWNRFREYLIQPECLPTSELW